MFTRLTTTTTLFGLLFIQSHDPHVVKKTKRIIISFITIGGMICLFLAMMSGEVKHVRLPDIVGRVESHNQVVQATKPPQKNYSLTDRLDIVVAFPRMMDKEMAKIGGYSGHSAEKLKERDLEFVDSIRRNLQHPAVSRVHLLNDQPDDLAKMLKDAQGIDLNKLTLIKSSKDVTFSELFGYVFKSLQGHYAMVINADLYLGDGFTKLDWPYLKRTRVMYSLTRKHVKPIPKGCAYNEKTLGSYCEIGSSYVGSHDCYLFYVTFQPSNQFFIELNHKINAHGGENVVIWAFRRFLKFTVLNPCKILSVHHNHCSGVRPPSENRKRININGKSGVAAPTDRLYV